jgi:DNA-binding transcriptional MocR family regulator
MAELVTYDALTSTQFRRHVDRYRDRLGKGIALTCQLADRNGFEVFGEPGGGKFVWLRLPGVEDSLDLARAATSFGVSLAPGQIFRPNLEPTPWFRINVAYADHPAVAAFLTACSGRLCHGN